MYVCVCIYIYNTHTRPYVCMYTCHDIHTCIHRLSLSMDCYFCLQEQNAYIHTYIHTYIYTHMPSVPLTGHWIVYIH